MSQSWKLWLAWLVIGSAIASWGDGANAQITPDTTLGNENSSVTPRGTVDSINGGATRGANLFHSFGEFNVGEGRAAVFTNPAGIENIITRVTGANPSNILGTLGVAGGNANLFLINPNGIFFGANARLDIRGSFVGTTANALQFSNLGLFSATDKNIPAPLLTINPSALLFNQIDQNAAIQNNSVAPAGSNLVGFDTFGLRVPNGKSLLLLGGNISMDRGELNAYGGRVELGGLSESGTVVLGVDGDNLSLKFPENVARASVSLINSSRVFVTGAGGGNIAVNAKNLEILGGSVLFGGIERGLGTPETVAGGITLNATGEIKVAGTGTTVNNFVRSGAKGNGGNITIDSSSFSLRDGARLQASTFGQGNAGNVTVSAKDAVSLASNARISNTVEASGVGNGGNIDINAATLSLIDGARLQASTSGQGNAGNVTVNAKDAVSLAYAPIFSTVGAGGVGNGGNIDINAATLSLIDGAQLLTNTSGADGTQPPGRGNAGNVNVKVTGTVDIAGEKNGLPSAILSRMETGTVGNGGNITIDSGSFSLRDGSRLATSTFGQGNAGNVTLWTKDAVSLASAPIFSAVGAGGVGNGGNIDINAATLSLIDGAQLLTNTRGASETQPPGQGNAGNVNVKVTSAVDIAGEKNNFRSAIFSEVQEGTVGNGGNITIDSGSFSLRNGARLQASTFGQGNAGNVTVSAKDAVSLTNEAYIFSTVEAGGVGMGGNINVNAATLSLINGGQLLTLTRGAEDTQPSGRGNAGNVNVKVTGAVDIAGEKNGLSSGISGILSEVQKGTSGNGGNITIDSGSLSLRDRAQLTAETLGQGNAGIIKVNAADFVTISGIDSGLFVNSQSPTGTAGDIIVTSPRVTLDSSGTFSAQSASGNGGNINLNVRDLLLLRRGAQISTTAGTAQAGGNGGNINIEARQGFIVAGVRENNDITANAFSGIGGQVAINTSGIFGIQRQERGTPQSDITASSQFGINGVVNINTPDVDPSRGLVALPTELADASGLIAQGCGARRTQGQSRFIVTGRGGLPPNPSDTINSDAVWIDLDSTTQLAEARPRSRAATQPTNSMPEQLVEATGWALNDKGQVVLTAYASATLPHSPGLIAAKCNVP